MHKPSIAWEKAMTPVDYLPLLVMIVVAIIFATLALIVSALLGPHNPTHRKLMPYESGNIVNDIEPRRRRFPVKFYLTAMLFTIFDVEVAFFYPWAVVFRDLKMFGFVVMLLFISVLLIGFFYLWKKGAFEWD
jgi:NADH-quinone oxidoreductase subunit A